MFGQPSQKGQPGVGMSADAARMSACATREQKLSGIGLCMHGTQVRAPRLAEKVHFRQIDDLIAAPAKNGR